MNGSVNMCLLQITEDHIYEEVKLSMFLYVPLDPTQKRDLSLLQS